MDMRENLGTNGGADASLDCSSPYRKDVVFFVVGEAVKSFPKSGVRFLGGEPPARYSCHSGTTRLSTAMEIPAMSQPAFLAR
jgi:hypothetical protein